MTRKATIKSKTKSPVDNCQLANTIAGCAAGRLLGSLVWAKAGLAPKRPKNDNKGRRAPKAPPTARECVKEVLWEFGFVRIIFSITSKKIKTSPSEHSSAASKVQLYITRYWS